MLPARTPGLQRHLHGHQHRLQPVHRDGCQHLRHHTVPARILEQPLLQLHQRLGHRGKRRPVAQRTGLLDDEPNVVLPVVEGVIALEAAYVARDLPALGNDDQFGGIDPQAHHPMGEFSRHAIAIALQMDQGGRRHARRQLRVAVEGTRQGHQPHLLVLRDLSDRQFRPLRVMHLPPRRPAALAEPRIECFQIRPAPFSGLPPDLAAPVLHILLDDALLPAGGAVAELRLEQVMPT